MVTHARSCNLRAGMDVSALIATAFLLFSCCSAEYTAYNTSSSRHPNKLNVHIICHSHDDAGWLKTVDQYYYGANQSIQQASVQDIFDTVIASLAHHPDRKFVLMEQAFFVRWWREQSPDTRDLVRGLFEKGQLDVWNGGWVQHDEAAAHYVAMIDQTTLGHRFLKQEFGFVPRVGFQADPFGHSATQAALLSAKVGFDALIFGRADYQDTNYRRRIKATELLWRGAESFGKHADVFTINLDGYWPVPGFWWEWGGNDEGMHDDPELEEYNIPQRVQEFFDRCMDRFAYTRGNDIMMTMGSDFHYSNAEHWYKNLDKLIHYANLDGRFNLFYSTPTEYVAAKASYGAAWPLKTARDDFFPYADQPHSYWTGYFTSRPTSKKYIRSATSYLQAARQLELFAAAHKDLAASTSPVSTATTATGGRALLEQTGKGTASPTEAAAVAPDGHTQTQRLPKGAGGASGGKRREAGTARLWAAVSLTQHHDSITGTEKQHVANDYHMRLARGLAEAAALVNGVLEHLLLSSSSPTSSPQPAATAVSGGAATVDGGGVVPASVSASARRKLADAAAEKEEDGFQNEPAGTAARQGPPQETQEVHESSHTPTVQLTQCPYLNASVCGASVGLSRLGRRFGIVLYNPLAWPRDAHVRVPIAVGTVPSWVVIDPEGRPVASQLLPVGLRTFQMQQTYLEVGAIQQAEAAADHELAFVAQLPPLGYTMFTLQPSSTSSAAADGGKKQQQRQQEGREEGGNGGGNNPHACAPAQPPLPLREAAAQLPGRGGNVSWVDVGGVEGDGGGDAQKEEEEEGGEQEGERGKKGPVAVTNGIVTLHFDPDTGRLASMSSGNTSTALDAHFLWYRSSDGSEAEQHGQCSGAYIFRPAGVAEVSPDGHVETLVTSGPVVTEVRMMFADWAHITLRLWAGAAHVESEWTVGPIPVDDNVGKEIVLRVVSGLLETAAPAVGGSEGGGGDKADAGDAAKGDAGDGMMFWTDSNGREMLPRTRNQRPSWDWQPTEPVAGNYYPLTSAMYIRSNATGDQLAIITDRAQGGSSLSPGSMEVMVHRRMVKDDWRGVGEDLNETECGCRDCDCVGLTARGTHLLSLSPGGSEAGAPHRTLQQLLNDPPLFAVAALGGAMGKPATTAAAAAAAASGGERSGDGGGSAEGDRQQQQQQEPWAVLRSRWSAMAPADVAPAGGGAGGDVESMQQQQQGQHDGVEGMKRHGGGGQFEALPLNVHLLTLQHVGERKALVRLAHLYQVGDHSELSSSARVDLARLLAPGLRVSSVSETTLTSNQCADRAKRMEWEAGEPLLASGATTAAAAAAGMPKDGAAAAAGVQVDGVMAGVPPPPPQQPLGCGVGLLGDAAGDTVEAEVVLGPMEVRTFEVEYA